jgi:uncharacterized protein (TIGR00255 family)
MVRSMTGFGQARGTAGDCRVTVEMKSVNHRYSEVVVRLPREWSFLEEDVKKAVQTSLQRGRADIFINTERETPAASIYEVDWMLAEGYINAARQLGERFGLQGSVEIKDLLRIPNMISLKQQPEDSLETIREPLLSIVHEALAGLIRMREQEGLHLREDLRNRMNKLKMLHGSMAELAPAAVEDYRQRLHKRIVEWTDGMEPDEGRIAAEAAIFADRSDIEEELTRLASHMAQFLALLDSGEPAGRKLDFLLQEMNREANTIGSKAGHAGLAGLSVEWKAELEKIREQAQNIE